MTNIFGDRVWQFCLESKIRHSTMKEGTMNYSQRFKENLDTALEHIPYFSFMPIAMTTPLAKHYPECPWIMCFLAVLGMNFIQLFFGVTVASIPKKDSCFFAIVTLVGIVIVIPALCYHWMGIKL